MPRTRRRTPKPDHRRALQLLASSGAEGCTEGIMLAHGFSVEQLVDLVRAGLATAETERVVARSSTFDVARVKITDAGRRAITDQEAK